MKGANQDPERRVRRAFHKILGHVPESKNPVRDMMGPNKARHSKDA